MEVWKTIEGFEDYQISNIGNVKSLERVSFHRRYGYFITKEKILKQAKNKRGYLTVFIRNNNNKKTFLVSRLVGIAFIPNPKNKSQINHKDGNKSNNNDWNLEWNTALENNLHAIKTGLRIGVKGEKNHWSKLTNKEVMEIRSSNLTHRKLGTIYNVCHSCIGAIKRNITWNI